MASGRPRECAAGLSIGYYFLFMQDDGWSAGVNSLSKTGIVGFVFWTGRHPVEPPTDSRWTKGRSTASA
jgi:hypothetical protein